MALVLKNREFGDRIQERSGKMNREERDKGGFQFSTQAEAILEDLEFTPEGADRFFKELARKKSVEISRVKAHFFLRGNKICVSKHRLE